MNLREQLLFRHSKENTNLIVNWVGEDTERVAQLIDLFTHDEYRVVQRAAWVVGNLGCNHPYLLAPHYPQILAVMQTPPHPAVLRNCLKFFADTKVALPEEEEGLLVELCFNQLIDPQTAVAIQVHAMQCIADRLSVYPELGIELKEIIELNLEHGSAGYKSRARQILQQIAKL